MKKILTILLTIIICLLPCEAANAAEKANKISIAPFGYDRIRDRVITTTLDNIEVNLPKLSFISMDREEVNGTVTYSNISEVAIGKFDLQWIFTPDDDKYDTCSGIFHLDVYATDSEESKGKMPEPTSVPDEPTPPSLTATSVRLMRAAAYDINIANKPTEASYSWTSSDTSIVEVNAKNGKIKAIKEGTATITCVLTYKDGTTENLTSIINVGYDENAPILTEDDLDLSIGDGYDINLENTVAKSSYRWVSSNKDIVKVNSLNGKVKAMSAGNAYVTCTITTPTKQVIVLKCDINVTE